MFASFVAQLFLDASAPSFVRDYLALSNRGVHEAYAWQFVTATLLYGSPWHFLGNMLGLYILGRDLESILGQRHFFVFVFKRRNWRRARAFVSNAVRGILYAASGGVAAVLLAYATILPDLDLIAWGASRFSLRLKAKHVANAILLLSLVMLAIGPNGVVIHSAIPGVLPPAGFTQFARLRARLLVRRLLHRRREAAERMQRMTPAQFIEREIDPLLEKISRKGIQSLTRAERRFCPRRGKKLVRFNPVSSRLRSIIVFRPVSRHLSRDGKRELDQREIRCLALSCAS